MLVYGDQREFASPGDQLARINKQLRLAGALPAGIERHAALVCALVEAGRLLQGIADADFAEIGHDRCTPATWALSASLQQLAVAVVRSWDGEFEAGPLPTLPEFSGAPPCVELRTPEGYGFYALYPEAYIEAARKLRLAAAPKVIAIRSIGTSLGAIVAAALGAPVATTVRPSGDPFARAVVISPELERDLLGSDAHYVIVDEGPGQSGSSFGAVADWLQDRGVPVERIAFLPSHAGPLGPQASEAHRRRWRRAQQLAGDFGRAIPHLLAGWLAALVGELDEPPVDLSGGEWRRHSYASEAHWPAVQPMWERRKFLATAGGSRFFVKFAGLGAIGARKLNMARALHAAGLTAEPVGLAHGFLVEHWCEQARPLSPHEKPIAEVARYIGVRARLFPASEGSGASLTLLHEMARRNISLVLGLTAAEALASWAQRLDTLSRRVVRVRTDNKLDPHEWLPTFDGRLFKTDALDHHCAHDLIGCQDVAWDVAAATVEFGLCGAEENELIASTELAAGRAIDRELLLFYQIAYAAFRLGQAAMAADAGGENVAEGGRLRSAGGCYRATLHHLLEPAKPRLGRKARSDEFRNKPLREQTSQNVG